MIDKQQTLGQLATALPTAARVFHRHGLDYCCGGNRSLAAACAESGLDLRAVLEELETAAAASPGSGERWTERTVPELVGHILERYHIPLKLELPRLVELASTVERVHASKASCPTGLAQHLAEMQRAVEDHMNKEEQILFPLVLTVPGRLARMPIQVMMTEHEEHGEALRRTRALTDNLRLPGDACLKWRELYRALGELEEELMEHIHLENSVLFPKVLEASGVSELL